METNPYLKAAMLEIVDNQLRENNPPETRQTFERLVAEGCTEEEAKKLIGCAVSTEIYHVLKNKEEFNLKRYCEALSSLPELPE